MSAEDHLNKSQFIYHRSPAEKHDSIMTNGLLTKYSRSDRVGLPKGTYGTIDDKTFGNESGINMYKVDTTGLNVQKDTSYTDNRARVVTDDITPDRITPHVAGTEHGKSDKQAW